MNERRKRDTREGEPLPSEWLEAAADYNRPPEAPREEIWAALEAELETGAGAGDAIPLHRVRAGGAGREAGGRGSGRRGRWWGLSVAAAALLALGIGIGRTTAPGVPGDPTGGPAAGPGGVAGTLAPEENGGGTAVRMAALEHLGRSESLLSVVRADARTGRVDPAVGRWAGDLLTETRLLMDAAAADDDVTIQRLLEDLELILAQIALLERSTGDDPVRGRTELDLIARGLEERNVMTRIQAVRPVGSGMLGT